MDVFSISEDLVVDSGHSRLREVTVSAVHYHGIPGHGGGRDQSRVMVLGFTGLS